MKGALLANIRPNLKGSLGTHAPAYLASSLVMKKKSLMTLTLGERSPRCHGQNAEQVPRHGGSNLHGQDLHGHAHRSHHAGHSGSVLVPEFRTRIPF